VTSEPSPEDIRRALEQVQQAYSPERMAEITRNLQRGLSAERMAEITRNIQTGFSPERMAEITRNIQTGLSAQRMAEISRHIQTGFSPERMRAIAEAMQRQLDAAGGPRIAPAVAEWQEAVEEAASAAAPEQDDGRSFAAWLFWLPVPFQLAILHAGLACVFEVTKFLEEAGHTDVPDELQAATAVMMSLMIFIIVVLQSRAGPPDD